MWNRRVLGLGDIFLSGLSIAIDICAFWQGDGKTCRKSWICTQCWWRGHRQRWWGSDFYEGKAQNKGIGIQLLPLNKAIFFSRNGNKIIGRKDGNKDADGYLLSEKLDCCSYLVACRCSLRCAVVLDNADWLLQAPRMSLRADRPNGPCPWVPETYQNPKWPFCEKQMKVEKWIPLFQIMHSLTPRCGSNYLINLSSSTLYRFSNKSKFTYRGN